MTFEHLLEQSLAELAVKDQANVAWGLGTFDCWNLNQDDAELVLSKDDGTTATAPAQILGTLDTIDGSWLWSWANPSVAEPVRLDAYILWQFGETHSMPKLTERKWKATESDAWAMAAIAVKLCEGQGAYRGLSGSTWVYMTFDEVTLTNLSSRSEIR